MRLIYLSHPEVTIDPAVPVPDWHLSPRGRARLMAAAGWPGPGFRIVSSPEVKARETAALIAGPLGLVVTEHAGTGEVDRSSTGYLPFDRHEALADALFAHPGTSAEGWETALAAQARMSAALQDMMAQSAGDLLLVGHGAVGTFLWCALTGQTIARHQDQPAGGGCVWQVVRSGAVWQPVHGWQRLEQVLAPPPLPSATKPGRSGG